MDWLLEVLPNIPTQFSNEKIFKIQEHSSPANQLFWISASMLALIVIHTGVA